MMNDGWYFLQGNDQKGPVAWHIIRGMALRGEISRQTMVYTSGMLEWRSAQETGLDRFFPPPPVHWHDTWVNRVLCILRPTKAYSEWLNYTYEPEPLTLLLPYFEGDEMRIEAACRKYLKTLKDEILDYCLEDRGRIEQKAWKSMKRDQSLDLLFEIEIHLLLHDTAKNEALLNRWRPEPD